MIYLQKLGIEIILSSWAVSVAYGAVCWIDRRELSGTQSNIYIYKPYNNLKCAKAAYNKGNYVCL